VMPPFERVGAFGRRFFHLVPAVVDSVQPSVLR